MWEFHTCIFQYTGSNIIRDLHMPFAGTAYPLVIFAILFYFGQNFNSTMMELSVTIYKSEWYQYPRSVQRFVLLMMQRSQRPFHFSAYGLIELHLQNYLGVSGVPEQTRQAYWNRITYIGNALQVFNWLNILNQFAVAQTYLFSGHGIAENGLGMSTHKNGIYPRIKT